MPEALARAGPYPKPPFAALQAARIVATDWRSASERHTVAPSLDAGNQVFYTPIEVTTTEPVCPMVLLGPNTPQSDHDPEAAAAASDGSFARHPLTGAFTEPPVESAWSASSFRDAFPLHAILLAAVLMIQLVGHAVAFAWYGWSAVWRLHVPLYLGLSLVALVGRKRLHRMQEDRTLTLT